MAPPNSNSTASLDSKTEAPEPEELTHKYHPLVEPYRKLRAAMWPPGTSEYVLKSSTPEWEARLIEKLTGMYEVYLRHLDEMVRQKEAEYEAKMKSDRSIVYKIMETHAYRSMTGGAVGYFYPQANEPNLDGPQRVREFKHRLLSIQRLRPKPKHFAVRESQALKSLPLEQQRTVGVAAAMVDEYCFRVSGTDDKIMLVSSMQMEALGMSGSARIAATVKPPMSGIKIPLTVPKTARANPQVRGATRSPGPQSQRGTPAARDTHGTGTQRGGAQNNRSQRRAPQRRPFDDEITEPVPAPDHFDIKENVSPRRALLELFRPAHARGQAVLDRLVRAKFMGPDRKVKEVLAALRMLGRQSGLTVKIKTPANAQGKNNISFRSEPGSLVIDEALLSKPGRLWEHAIHDAAAIYLFRQYNGVWPNARNTSLHQNYMGRIVRPEGGLPPNHYQDWFETFVITPTHTLELLGLTAPPQSLP